MVTIFSSTFVNKLDTKNMVKILQKNSDKSDFQTLMRQLYFQRDKKRGLDKTLLWFVEEVGELVQAIRKKESKEISEELADVYAWLCSIANLLELDLLKISFTKYPGRCPRCNESICQCPEIT